MISDNDILASCEKPKSESEANQFLVKLIESYEFFIRALWYPIGSWKVAPLDTAEIDAINYMQHGPQKRGVIGFRSIGKTHFITGGLAAWYLLRDPDKKILIVSKTLPEARKTVKMIRAWFQNIWFLQHLQPNKQLGQTDSLTEIECGPARDSRNPSITAVGITGQLPSKRAHIVIGDDVETAENTKTPEARAELMNTLTEFRAISSYGDQEIVFAGTYHNEDSVYPKLAKKGYEFITIPKVYPTLEERDGILNLAPSLAKRLDSGLAKPGDITCPLRVTKDDIVADKAEGFRYWSMQCMCMMNLGQTNRYPLRLKDLIVQSVDTFKAPVSVTWGTKDHNGSTRCPIPALGLGDDAMYGPVMVDAHWSAYEGPTRAAIDPAGRGDDRTGLAIAASLAGMVWVKAVHGLEGGASEERLTELVSLLRRHNVREALLETNNDVYGAYQSMLQNIIQKHVLKPNQDPLYPKGWNCSIKTIHSTMMKETRIIQTLEPIISGHRLVIDPSCLQPEEDEMENELQFQLTRICNERNCLREDGKIDALQMVVGSLVNSTKRDPFSAAGKARERDGKLLMADMMRREGAVIEEPSWIRHLS
jgi:hypothetical protein